MFKTEKNRKLNCVVYYKPMSSVLNTSATKPRKPMSEPLKKITTLYNSEYRSRLEYLLTYKIKDSTIKEAILTSVRNNLDLCDKKIYEDIVKIITEVECNKDRGNYRISSINKYINNWDDIAPTFYLDIGCYQGDITETISKHFKLNKFQTRGIDIKKYTENENFIFTKYDGKVIPFNDESFDLITCFMVLHHVPTENLDVILNNAFRVMKPGGMLIIREHNAEGNDHLLLDTLHEYYDYVLNPDHVWSESSAYYCSLEHLRKKIINVGFKPHSVPKIKRNNPKNPFNNYVASFKKPEKKVIQRDFFRILTPNFHREPYESHMNHRRSAIHWGQRKLLLSEIEFLCIYFERFPRAYNDIVVVYAGAAPGTHILLLRSLFPNIQFVLYDPARFDSAICDVPGITTNQELFTNETCLFLKDKYVNNVILFISDIRTADTITMSSEEIEERVAQDQQMQMEWYHILDPVMAMFKFRLPWNDSTTSYLKGDIYFQTYAPLTSTETRLIVEQNAPLTDYDNKAYEEQMFYFNKYLRESHYLIEENTDSKPVMYDVAVEEYILKKYATLNIIRHFREHEPDFMVQFSEHINNMLSRGRILRGHPIPHNKKELVKKMVSEGLVPPNIKYTVDDYNLYVTPIIGRV